MGFITFQANFPRQLATVNNVAEHFDELRTGVTASACIDVVDEGPIV